MILEAPVPEHTLLRVGTSSPTILSVTALEFVIGTGKVWLASNPKYVTMEGAHVVMGVGMSLEGILCILVNVLGIVKFSQLWTVLAPRSMSTGVLAELVLWMQVGASVSDVHLMIQKWAAGWAIVRLRHHDRIAPTALSTRKKRWIMLSLLVSFVPFIVLLIRTDTDPHQDDYFIDARHVYATAVLSSSSVGYLSVYTCVMGILVGALFLIVSTPLEGYLQGYVRPSSSYGDILQSTLKRVGTHIAFTLPLCAALFVACVFGALQSTMVEMPLMAAQLTIVWPSCVALLYLQLQSWLLQKHGRRIEE